jgi:hypothetical protein
MNAGKHNSELQAVMTRDPDKPDAPRPQSSPETKKKKAAPRENATELQQRQSVIGHELRRMFEDVVKEPVPSEMLDLLRQIEQKEAD